MDNDNKRDSNKTKRRIMILIIIIIIIISLITSCSCTSKLWGRIGNIFENKGEFDINSDTNEEKININTYLRFDTSNVNMYLSDTNLKITYTYKNINPKEFTCITSNADIATCYVKDGYVVVNPKQVGKVNIILETKANGEKYQAKTEINIKESNRYILLSSPKGTIYLNENKIKNVTYNLINLIGDVKVIINDKNIVSASAKNGILKITGLKKGNTTITLKVIYEGKEYTTTYKVYITDSKNNLESNHNLKALTSSVGSLDFKSNVYKYYLGVSNSQDKVSFEAFPSSSKSTLTYKFNGKEVSDLKNLELQVGNNKLEITVTAEDGTSSTYEVTIERKNSPSSGSSGSVQKPYLENLEITEDFKFNEEFNKNRFNYTVDVPFNQNELTLSGTPENRNNEIKYHYNGKTSSNLKDFQLQPGDNQIEIEVSNGTSSTTYTVTVHRKIRNIIFEKEEYIIYLEDGSIIIKYSIDEEGTPITDYDLNDIKMEIESLYQNNIELTKGEIKVTPQANFADKKTTLTLNYEDASTSSSTNLQFLSHNYYLTTYSDTYDLSLLNETGEKNIVLNTNFFLGKVKVEEIDGNLKICSELEPNICINISYNREALEITFNNDNGNTSLSFKVRAKQEGKYQIHIEGIAPNYVKELDITINVNEKYLVTLNANGGFYDEFTTIKEYTLAKGSTLNLANELAYKATDNCKYYEIASYNTETDGKGKTYSLEEIEIDSNLYLYAIYNEKETFEKNFNSKSLYLTEVDLFHNEEYEQKYGQDKVIYPGAKGSYTMVINNNSGKTINLTNINLTENEVCVNNKCLNMGYIFKYSPKIEAKTYYYYGEYKSNQDNYKILNEDNHVADVPLVTDNDPFISVSNGEAIEIILFWKWIEKDDIADTKIGIMAAEQGNTIYELTVRLDFETIDNTCEETP